MSQTSATNNEATSKLSTKKYISKKAPKVKTLDVVFTESSEGRSRAYFIERPNYVTNPERAAPTKCFITGTHSRGLGPKSDRRGGQRSHSLKTCPESVLKARQLKKIKDSITAKPQPAAIEPFRFKEPAPVNPVKHQDLLDKAAAERQSTGIKATIDKSDPRLVAHSKQQQLIAKKKQWLKEQAAKKACATIPIVQHKPLYTKAQRLQRERILAELEAQHLSQQRRKQLNLFYKAKLHIICFDNPTRGVKLIRAQKQKSFYSSLVAAYKVWNQFSHSDKAVIRYMTPQWAEKCFSIPC